MSTSASVAASSQILPMSWHLAAGPDRGRRPSSVRITRIEVMHTSSNNTRSNLLGQGGGAASEGWACDYYPFSLEVCITYPARAPLHGRRSRIGLRSAR
eukprot:521233-Prymnesium_polylepis.1